MNYLEAESRALQLAYSQFFGENQPIGIAFYFINERKAGRELSSNEKETIKQISNKAIINLKRQNLTRFICEGLVPDCAMARRFMATGSGQTAEGYNF